MKLFELQKLVLPDTQYSQVVDIFVRCTENNLLIDGRYKKTRQHEFNTWMNMFAAKKWYYYCELGQLYLQLDIASPCTVQVVGSVFNSAFQNIDTILLEQKIGTGLVNILVPDAEKYDGLYYVIFSDTDSVSAIRSINWCTNKEPQYDNKMAIVSCTFKREKYIARTMHLFESFIKTNTHLKNKIKLFVIDNGKTLDISSSTDDIAIYHNMNAGGAGGFTRGLLEVSKLDFSRVLFMDDDVEILPASFERTLTLSNYLKYEFKDSFINGAMLDLYRKDWFFENLALQNKIWVKQFFKDISLNDYQAVLRVNDIPAHIFKHLHVDSAWYYHCFSINKFLEKGLPLPVFFRGDDVEWSWRHMGTHHISMNGICIWHAPFAWRVGRAAENYYMFRNMFMINCLHTFDFKEKFCQYFTEKFLYLLKTYDWVGIELLFKAMDDILSGSQVFRENPEIQFNEIQKIEKKARWIDSFSLEELNHIKWVCGNVYKPRFLKRLIYKFSFHGIFWPKKLMSENVALDWFPPVERFMLKKRMKVYNLLNGKYEVRDFSRKKYFSSRTQFKKRLECIYKNYDAIKADFKTAHKEFVTEEFWKKYLGV